MDIKMRGVAAGLAKTPLTNTSGRFVAPMTVTPINSSTPSISFNKLSKTPPCVPLSESESISEREVARASISSYTQSHVAVTVT